MIGVQHWLRQGDLTSSNLLVRRLRKIRYVLIAVGLYQCTLDQAILELHLPTIRRRENFRWVNQEEIRSHELE